MSTGSGNAANMKYAVSKKMPIAIFEMGGGGMYKRMNARMHLQLKQTQNIYIRDCTPNFYGQKYQLQGNVIFVSTIFYNIVMISSSTLNAIYIYVYIFTL